MHIPRWFFAVASMFAVGCGPATVSPLPVDAALSGDVAAPADASAAPVDVASPTSLRAACQAACDRQQRECGTASQRCVESCADVERVPRANLCGAQIVAAVACAAANPFVCMGTSGEPAAVCRGAFQAAQRCVDGSPSTPPDAG